MVSSPAAASFEETTARTTGVGLRLPHLTEVAAGVSGRGWFEVHPENFLANPHARELLQDIARTHPLSLHTVGLSVGTATGLDRRHLQRLYELTVELDPVLVSGHLAWSSYGDAYLNDLLPLPYNDETLDLVTAHVHEVQDALGRRYVVENPASYLTLGTSTLTEAEFLGELVTRTGCQLLCDVSNAYLSAANLGYDVDDYVCALPKDSVAEIHLAGFTRERETGGGGPCTEVLIDTHADAVAPPVWDLYARVLHRFGPRPTLIEWDNALPPFARLQAEARKADAVAASVRSRGQPHASAG
jgi:uncharacterized protein (UPF0276 family)